MAIALQRLDMFGIGGWKSWIWEIGFVDCWYFCLVMVNASEDIFLFVETRVWLDISPCLLQNLQTWFFFSRSEFGKILRNSYDGAMMCQKLMVPLVPKSRLGSLQSPAPEQQLLLQVMKVGEPLGAQPGWTRAEKGAGWCTKNGSVLGSWHWSKFKGTIDLIIDLGHFCYQNSLRELTFINVSCIYTLYI